MNLYGEGTHRFTCSSVLYSTVHLFWCWGTGYYERIAGWMAQSSECGIKALALHIALRYVLTLNIGNIFLQIRNNYFPSLIKLIIGILMKRAKLNWASRIENASCFPGSQVLLYAELLDLQCFWFLVTFLHRAQYAVKRLCIICFLSSALTDTLMAFCLFFIPWYQICYEQNWNISMYFSNSCNSC